MLIKLKSGEKIKFDDDFAFATMTEKRIKVETVETNKLLFWAPVENVEYWIKREQN